MSVDYEWDYEITNAGGDIVDHWFGPLAEVTKYGPADLGPGETGNIVLVRTADRGERTWAYVADGELPDYFTDAYDRRAKRVPKRFKREWDAMLDKIEAHMFARNREATYERAFGK